MRSLDAAIDDFLDRYAGALTRFDARATAALWATPGMIVDDRFVGAIDDAEAMVQGLEQSYPLYRALGLASVGYDCLRVDELTPRLRVVQVRWHFYDADGEQLTDSSAYYVLRRDDDGLRACACIEVDGPAKLSALAAARGVDLSDVSR